MSDLPKAFIRVTRDGANTRFELMVEGYKVADLSEHELHALAEQVVGALRWVIPFNKPYR